MFFSMRCNAKIAGVKATNLVGLERYTGRAAYDFAEDAELLEWDVRPELRANFDKCSNLQ